MPWQNDLVLVLRDVVQSQATLDQVLLGINRRSSDYAGPSAFPEVAQQVVAGSSRESWTREFVRELLWRYSANTRLQNFRDNNPEVSPTRLREKESDYLREGLEAAFPSYEELAPVIGGASSGIASDEIVGRVMGQAAPDFIQRVIAWFDARGAAEKLIEAVLVVENPVLIAMSKSVTTAIKAREAAHGYRRPKPVEACLLDGRVFIDRLPLREAIKAWSSVPRRPILAVNGRSRLGNTYSLQLINYVAVQESAFKVASVNLGDEQHIRFRPGDLARRIILQLGHSEQLQYMPKETESGSAARWAIELCDWLVGLAQNAKSIWIIALDRFCSPDLPSETRDMIQNLLKKAAVAGSPIRMVLLQYSEDLLPNDIRRQNQVSFEPLRQLTRDDLLQFVERLADQQGILVDDGVFDQIADDIVSKAPLENIEAVAAELQRWFEGLSQAE